MNYLNILLVYLINMVCEEKNISVQKVFFLGNNFWCIDQEQIKTDKGYLYRVYIDLESKDGYTEGICCFSNIFYPLESTNFGYILLKVIEKDIISFFKSSEINTFLWRFRFLFTDKPIDSSYNFENSNVKLQEYVTYKLPKKTSENSLSLSCGVTIDILLKHIKERFEGLIEMKLLKFSEYLANVNKMKIENKNLSKIEDDANFDLHYFKNHSECFENLKNFIEKLCYFNLLKDGFFDLFSGMFVFNTTTLNVSQFKKRLFEKFYENLKKLNGNKTDETWNELLDECYCHIKNEMFNNNIFLPIGGKYDIDYYIEVLSNLIYESAKEKIIEADTSSSEDNDFIFLEKDDCSLNLNFEKLQSMIIKDFCESEYIPKHFSKLLGKEVETLDDYIEVEKMVCDYYNMFVYIFNLYCEYNEDSRIIYLYVPPIITNDQYNLKIIDGIEIKWQSKLREIKIFNDKEEEITMVNNIDYFIDRFDDLYFLSNILKMKNIYEFEVVSFDDKKNIKKFKINEYLSI